MSSIHDRQFIDLLYLLAAALFIVGLRRLGSPKTARSGNTVAGVGMIIGLAATLLHPGFDFTGVGFLLIVVGVVIGTFAGVFSGRTVKMTAMPQMVAFFNGLGGGCVALIAIAEVHIDPGGFSSSMSNVALVGTAIGAIIGSMSFSGSVVAFLKLQEVITGRPVTWPLQRAINALLAAVVVGLGAAVVQGGDTNLIIGTALLASVLGVFVVLPIGGADMPVIISLLNSLTGLAACAAGFALGNSLLIIAGIIVGASGFLLTKMMGEAMNRTIPSVLFGAFGGGDSGGGAAALTQGTVRVATVDDVAIMLAYSRRVVVVPGYGLAVAQAQHSVRELADLLEDRGVSVVFGIHPVAGRMPGHMNVLLAEANVPYEQLKEMDEVNPAFKQTDVVLVIGANDVVNPSARTEPGSPLFGMPVLDVGDATTVIVMKRGMSAGFAGVDNPLFVAPNTQMLFGDAKASLNELVTAVGAV
ncbi:MAG: NAD(P)(+) transhydrogenase (Re/Si-specific) subunit beta [Thermoleophilia bacterium]|nr:NAD(P)(+) transhydrogenase (Re/Si-specific) subunit beta [Thermoleophilia bacterium]